MDALFSTASDIDINSSLFPLLDFRGTQKSRDRNPPTILNEAIQRHGGSQHPPEPPMSVAAYLCTTGVKKTPSPLRKHWNPQRA
ncbi:hypothetical protein EYF80_054875 [Liparis tanakae]|uniref:Uncharacterized protein n=1 Tax=Liparis tanakae TaxID=230148 RepID=A0A4Z2F1E2_9TELE|nr:hypothetical protein EYF80_054875 [Liparis tanakae]